MEKEVEDEMREMTLMQLKEIIPMNVVRDATVKSAGFLDVTYGDCNFVFIRGERNIEELNGNKNISAVFVAEDMVKNIDNGSIGIVVSDNPERLFYEVHNKLVDIGFYGEDVENSIGKTAIIDASVRIAAKNVIIGENVIIEPNVTIMENVKIGNNCYIGAGTVIGARTFKYYKDEKVKINMKRVGWVEISDNVEIISNSCIEPGIIDNTVIGEHSVINSLVNIGHGVKLGKNVIVSTGVVIAGSTVVDDYVWIGLNSTIKQKLHIGKKAYVCMGSVVSKDVKAGQKVSGNFAVEHSKNVANVKRISQM